jgi:hypothetical protein
MVLHTASHWSCLWARQLSRELCGTRSLRPQAIRSLFSTQHLANHVSEHGSCRVNFVAHAACVRRQLRVPFFSLPAVNLPYFLRRITKCWFTASKEALQLGKIFLNSQQNFYPEILAVLFQILSFSFWYECGLSHKLSLSPPSNNTCIWIWRSSRPHSPSCQPFAEYLFLDTRWEVLFAGQDVTPREGTEHFFFFHNCLKMMLELTEHNGWIIKVFFPHQLVHNWIVLKTFIFKFNIHGTVHRNMTRSKTPTRCNSVTEFIIPLMSVVQHVSSVMSFIIRNLNSIWASGLQMLVETARGAVQVPTRTAPRAVSTSVCKPEAQIQLRFQMMSEITLETCWTIDISGIINSVTELHLVGVLLLVLKTVLNLHWNWN